MAIGQFSLYLVIQSGLCLLILFKEYADFSGRVRLRLNRTLAFFVTTAYIRLRFYRRFVGRLLFDHLEQLDRNLVSIGCTDLSLMKGVFVRRLVILLLMSLCVFQLLRFVVF